jgi:predicted nucleotidyltransferase component of viral defense system
MLTREQIQRAAGEMGFAADTLEKVWMLLGTLKLVYAHPFLGPRVALKGGTALNLFVLDLPRLSVDIDLNYIGAIDRTTMMEERPKIDMALEQVIGRAGLTVKRSASEHAGGKWRLSYTSALGRPAILEIDVNFMLRTPLWPMVERDSLVVIDNQARAIPVLDEHELAAGKLAALFARGASRDLFDVRELLRRPAWDMEKLRIAFVVYGGINRVDWRTVSVENVTTTTNDMKRQLLPMLRQELRPEALAEDDWTTTLVKETRELLRALLPLRDHEFSFLDRLNVAGEICAELLTEDADLQDRIRANPGLRWKARNVMKHFAPSGDDMT